VLLLGIDTSAAVTAAVHDGRAVLAERSVHDPRRHAELLAPMVAEVLREAGAGPRDLTGVAVGVGPGPFTGLRVGLVTARTLGHVLDVPVHGLCSLDALAAAAAPGLPGGFLVATDARRREVYWARYAVAAGVARRVEGPHVGAASDVDVRALPVVGRGAVLYPDALPGPPVAGLPQDPLPLDPLPLDPRAGALAALVAAALRGRDGAEILPPVPLYLRRPDAREPGAPKRVLS
jgi:tRNA threonylcarbamoyladenosine biosynthesis protein TsaB